MSCRIIRDDLATPGSSRSAAAQYLQPNKGGGAVVEEERERGKRKEERGKRKKEKGKGRESKRRKSELKQIHTHTQTTTHM